MSFDLRTLRHFVTLASRLNYARAADELRIAQPTLTRSIQSLEAHLGLRLFDRDRSGVSLTFQGERIVEQARTLLADAAELEVGASKAAQGQRGRVRFGMAPMPARAILAATLKRRYIAAPEVTYDVVVRKVSDLWPLLLSGDIEFFVGAEGQIPEAPVIRTDTLGTFPISLLVRDGHPLLNDIEKGRTFPLLLASGANPTLPPSIASRVAAPPSVIEDFETLQRLTASSDAIWLSSIYAVQDEVRAGSLRELPAFKPEPTHLRMVMHSLERRTESPAVADLKLAIVDEIRNLTP